MDNEKQKNHFLELSECVLKRDEKTGEYTLGREDFDRLYGINDVIVLSPDSDNVARLASVTYLMGMAGYETIGFVAVAAGYLATYKNIETGNTKTLLISGYEKYNIDTINELYKIKGKKLLFESKFESKKISDLYNSIKENDSLTIEKLKQIIKLLFEKIKEDKNIKFDMETLNMELEKTLKELDVFLSSASKNEIIQTIYSLKNRRNQSKNIVDLAWNHNEIASINKSELKDLVNQLMSQIQQEKYSNDAELKSDIKNKLGLVLKEKNQNLSGEDKELISDYFYRVFRTITAFTKVDDDNCDKNNLIICRAIFDDDDMARLIYDIYNSITDKSTTALRNMKIEDFESVARLFFAQNEIKKNDDEITTIAKNLKKFTVKYLEIIDTYFKYITIDESNPENNNNSQILNTEAKTMKNNFKQSNEKKEATKYYMTIVAITNLCATDYNAVAAGKFLRSISGIENNEKQLKKAQSRVIPQTPETNGLEKSEIRKKIASMTPFRTYRTR